MKRCRPAILAVLWVSALPLVARHAPSVRDFDFYGARLGMTLEDFKKLEGPVFYPSGWNHFACTDTYRIIRREICRMSNLRVAHSLATFYFLDERLARITYAIPHDQFRGAYQELVDRFGTPLPGSETHQDQSGGALEGATFTWSTGHSDVVAHEVGDTLDQSLIVFRDFDLWQSYEDLDRPRLPHPD